MGRFATAVIATAFVCTAAACDDRSWPLESGATAPPPLNAANGGPPTPADPTPFLAQGFCAFDVLVETTDGKLKTITLPGGRAIVIAPGYEITLTNLDNQRQETFSATGAFHYETLDSGALQLVVTGRNLLGAPGGGLTLTIGRLTLVLDEGSGLFLPVGEATGRVIDLCALLA
jgi:hypothetical protein